MEAKIWYNRYFRKRNNVFVILALSIITGILVSQNYLQDANATLFIQQHAIPYDYDIGGAAVNSKIGKVEQAISAASPLQSVNFTTIALPHLNFSKDPLASETTLLDNASRASLARGALLRVNSWVFSTPLGRDFSLPQPVQPGIYLQAAIGTTFQLPAATPFIFSFGTYNDTLATSPTTEVANFTAVAQNVTC